MATVNTYQYEHYDGNPFNPGQEAVWAFGPWPWTRHGVVVTAHPFDLSTSNRSLEVVHTRLATHPGEPAGEKFVVATIRNNGPDTLYIYYVTLTDIVP
jgi:hypothetical protein